LSFSSAFLGHLQARAATTSAGKLPPRRFDAPQVRVDLSALGTVTSVLVAATADVGVEVETPQKSSEYDLATRNDAASLVELLSAALLVDPSSASAATRSETSTADRCALLAALQIHARSAAGLKQADASAAVATVLPALASPDPATAVASTKLLRNLFTLHESIRIYAASKGAVRSLIGVLASPHLRNDARVAECSLNALASLVPHEGLNDAVFRGLATPESCPSLPPAVDSALGDSALVPAIIGALESHPADALVLSAATSCCLAVLPWTNVLVSLRTNLQPDASATALLTRLERAADAAFISQHTLMWRPALALLRFIGASQSSLEAKLPESHLSKTFPDRDHLAVVIGAMLKVMSAQKDAASLVQCCSVILDARLTRVSEVAMELLEAPDPFTAEAPLELRALQGLLASFISSEPVAAALLVRPGLEIDLNAVQIIAGLVLCACAGCSSSQASAVSAGLAPKLSRLISSSSTLALTGSPIPTTVPQDAQAAVEAVTLVTLALVSILDKNEAGIAQLELNSADPSAAILLPTLSAQAARDADQFPALARVLARVQARGAS
jgi:hypothetical protein